MMHSMQLQEAKMSTLQAVQWLKVSLILFTESGKVSSSTLNVSNNHEDSLMSGSQSIKKIEN